MLTAPNAGEDLFMYLLVFDHVVSATLLRDQGVQQPIYYVSKTLVDAETRYLPLEKLILALVHVTRKLPYYFQAHIIYVLIEYPLQSLLKKSDYTGRIAKWGTRLGSFDIRYRPRTSMKGQVLADFVASGKTSYEPVFEGKRDSSGQGAESTCELISHFSIITNRGGTSVNQSGAGGGTKYKCKGRCYGGGNIRTMLDRLDH